MNKKIFIFILLAIVAIFICTSFTTKELDRIENYEITVTPQDDGSLSLLYDISWKVLDSTTEGPLTWVQIGIPNSSVDNITALTKNIDSIEQYRSTYVKIVFKESYNAGDVVNFRFKIHQNNMYSLKNDMCVYEFTPGWFEDIAVDNITVKWKAGNVSYANTETRESGYYVWNDSLKKNEKLETKIEYEKNIFTNVSESNSINYAQKTVNNFSSAYGSSGIAGIIALLIIIGILGAILSIFTPDSYYSHRGYAGHHHSHHHIGGRSGGCACVSSCACACACAGGGRAGCSKKDFYGTKLKSKDILEKL